MIDTTHTSGEAQGKAAELLEPADYDEFLLRYSSEILQILRQLLDHGSQITIFFNEGSDLILTTLLAVSDDGLIVDYGASTDMNRRAASASKFFCVTQLDKVRVQFILRGLKPVTHMGLPAFHAALPDSVLRLQRREFYRLTMPVTRRLACQMPLDDGQMIEVDVVDLSGGGLALVLPRDRTGFEPGKEFANCHLELPEIGSVTVTIKVLSVFESTLRNGSRIKRAGCRFVNLPGTMTNLIQRYIIKIDRERKAFESGLG